MVLYPIFLLQFNFVAQQQQPLPQLGDCWLYALVETVFVMVQHSGFIKKQAVTKTVIFSSMFDITTSKNIAEKCP